MGRHYLVKMAEIGLTTVLAMTNVVMTASVMKVTVLVVKNVTSIGTLLMVNAQKNALCCVKTILLNTQNVLFVIAKKNAMRCMIVDFKKRKKILGLNVLMALTVVQYLLPTVKRRCLIMIPKLKNGFGLIPTQLKCHLLLNGQMQVLFLANAHVFKPNVLLIMIVTQTKVLKNLKHYHLH